MGSNNLQGENPQTNPSRTDRRVRGSVYHLLQRQLKARIRGEVRAIKRLAVGGSRNGKETVQLLSIEKEKNIKDH